MTKINPSEITSEHTYLSRKQFLKGMGFVGATALLAACAPNLETSSGGSSDSPTVLSTSTEAAANTGPAEVSPVEVSATADELGDELTSYKSVTNFNNFYEFSTDKEDVARLAEGYVTEPWSVQVGGMVRNPKTFGIDDLRAFEQEERIYRLRCVEGWSMVIPWVGFPLKRLLDEVEPTSDAKYVRFETVMDVENMPGQKSRWYEWPYIEGLRIDEAMNDLAILATGLYGKNLLPQSGAPIRLVVPWKYGFKSIKSIVKIDLVENQPRSLWMAAASNEYGFYANVNPDVPHPRWSQSTERRIGELSRRATLKFNGYEEQVGYLYEGMDLRANY